MTFLTFLDVDDERKDVLKNSRKALSSVLIQSDFGVR